MQIGDRVRIEGTNTAFDNKEGVIEEIQTDYCTVFVDFIPNTDKKVRQTFSIDKVFPITQEVDDIEEVEFEEEEV